MRSCGRPGYRNDGYDSAELSEPPNPPPAGPRGDLTEVSLDWLSATDPTRRKRCGQYLTPRPVAAALLDRLELKPGMRILDPGVGTGELLRRALDREPGLEAVGWDDDPGAIEAALQLVPEAELEIRSALEAPAGADFDLVIGNPPYFQLRLDRARRERFAGVISGRANAFALFFQVGLEQLREGGRLGYVVPPSMNSGAYFEALREFLIGEGEIRDLTLLEGTGLFEGANTAAQLLVIEKTKDPDRAGRFFFRREVPEAGFRRVIFSQDPKRLAAEFEGRKTMWELGLEAVTGQVVWNQNRDRLHEESGPGRVPLVWSHSIDRERLVEGPEGIGLVRPGKPGFFDAEGAGRTPLLGPAIVVNRVVGAVGRGELRAGLVPEGTAFLAENHVNVIRPRQSPSSGGSDNRRGRRKSDPPLVEGVWERVLASLRESGVSERVRLLTGNTQISARELTHLLPLD